MSVSFYVTGIDGAIATLSAVETKALAKAATATAKAAQTLERVAKNICPVGDTGRLKASILAEPTGPYSWVVQGHVDYQVYVEYGTRAHGPRTKKFMVFKGRDGKMVFTKWVRGTPPRAHMGPAKDIAAAYYAITLRHLV